MSAVASSNVLAAWGKKPPEWVQILAEECDRTSQKKVAEQIRYSTAVVNQVLKNRYTGNLTDVEKAVRGAYLNATVACPVLGDLPLNNCLQHQRQRFSAANNQRVRLYRACHGGCPHARQKGFSLVGLLASLLVMGGFIALVTGVAAQFVPEPTVTLSTRTTFIVNIGGHPVTCTETVDHQTGARSRAC
jgi:hypothetical protein